MTNFSTELYTNAMVQFPDMQGKVGIEIICRKNHINYIYSKWIFMNIQDPLSDVEFQKLKKDTIDFTQSLYEKQFGSIILRDKYVVMRINNIITLYTTDGVVNIEL